MAWGWSLWGCRGNQFELHVIFQGFPSSIFKDDVFLKEGIADLILALSSFFLSGLVFAPRSVFRFITVITRLDNFEFLRSARKSDVLTEKPQHLSDL
jgi:hypothetical protein